jgi:hypothetical protein
MPLYGDGNLTLDEFEAFHVAHPEIYRALVAIATEQRLDQWRTKLVIGEIIEELRKKSHKMTNDVKPRYARKYNDEFGHDGA